MGDESEGTERGQIWKVFIVEPKGLIDGLVMIEQKVKMTPRLFVLISVLI